MMDKDNCIRVSLFLLRATVFLVMFIWTLDKFLNPENATAVFAHFYFIKGISFSVMQFFGGIELILIGMFLLGIKKKLSYGAVLLFHAISTITSFPMYLKPFALPNILFHTAWPMLAACITLFLLRDADTLYTFKGKTG